MYRDRQRELYGVLPKKYSEDNQHVMIRMKYLVAAATLSLMLSGCSGNKEILPDASPSELYTVGQEKLQDGNYKGAITQLETLDNRFPFGPYSQQVQLDLIYAYYKAGDLQMALASIDRFMRLNPTHPNIDYVLYMRGLTAQALDDNMLQSFFGIDRADRDPQNARVAFQDFSQLLRYYPTSIYGINPDYLEIRKYTLAEGDMFTEEDILGSAKVCVVGKTIVDNLFTNGENPVGQIIRFGKIPFRIIGVLTSKGYNTMGMDQDDLILAPYTTVQKRILAITHLQSIFCSALSEDQTELAEEEIASILRRNHRLKESDDDDFNIRSQQELSSMMNSTTDMMTMLLACIAGISLLVGGIGIMNIMYVSVTERTREIGLRMSIGAKGRDILAQFLIEAILISVTGGLIGVVFGIGASWVVKLVAGWPVYVQLYSVVLSFVVCTVTGIFFGWYPAQKASNLDPIEAIRYE